MFSRTELVLGDTSKLQNSNILLLGVGGVGGFVLEMLVRLGVKNITVIDCDKFEKSNLNRQILALSSNLGEEKVKFAEIRAKNINKDVNITAKNIKVTPENVEKIVNNNFDYVIDAIDDIKAKVAVIKFCKNNNINIICSMGTGNRCKIPQFVVEDISKTSYDALAKKMRSELKKEGIFKGVDVVYTKEPPQKTQGLGSVVYYPLVCAGVIVSFVVNKILSI